MSKEKDLKIIVKEKYRQIATQQKPQNACSCCCSPEPVEITMIGAEYDNEAGYVKDADLGLGCGIPTEYANLNIGDTVVDLGSGAGNDVFIARSIVGESGRVIGIDMTDEMIKKARRNNEKLGYKNIEFHLAEIEAIPIESNSVNVVLSNCVLNLIPNKQNAFKEIYRILKPNAHFCISDIVLRGELPTELKESALLYTGCVAGALQIEDYLGIISSTGFKKVEIKKEKRIDIPADILQKYLSNEEIENTDKLPFSIISITVVGYKIV